MTRTESRFPVFRKVTRVLEVTLQALLPMSSGLLDSKQARYWRGLSLRRMAAMLLALFFTVSAWGFFLDLTEWKRQPLWALFVSAALFGATGIVSFVMIRRRAFRLLPVLVVFGFALFYIPRHLPHGPDIAISGDARARIALDAICIMASTMLGYRLILLFINTEGDEQIRTRTELDLAYGMQQMLVPTITHRSELFEAYGISLPSEAVGGDLVDLIATESGWMACLADVSGHGIQASLLMGNLKTALRFGFAQGQSLPKVIAEVCKVLPQVKPVEMYATFAGLRFAGSQKVEYLTAGHPAILHFREANQTIDRLGMAQFPLGLTGDCAYDSAVATYAPGDLFVLLSDGVMETEDAQGKEFGFDSVEGIILQHNAGSLKEIMNHLRSELKQFGNRTDDQTVLLIRARA
jgi:serine phosphatase RsbU (regulator of sigma subunit)